jgi:hypothetical protein
MSKQNPDNRPASGGTKLPRTEKLSLPPTSGMTTPPRPPKLTTPTGGNKK